MEVNTAEKIEEGFETQAMTLYEQAMEIKVCDKETYTKAGEFVKPLKDLEKKIIDYFKPLKEAAHKAHKAITERETGELGPVREAMDLVRKAMNAYLLEVETARKKAEAELRLKAEEEARRERERLIKLAEKAIEKGQDIKAEELLDQHENVYTAPTTVERDMAAKTDTVSLSAAMETEVIVVDLKAFIAGLVQKNMAPTMLDVKQAPLKAWVKANAFTIFPGLTIREVPKARIR